MTGMLKAERQALRRLIKREQAERLLRGFASGMPGIGLALVGLEGNLYARAGEWQPGLWEREAEPANGVLAAALAQASEDQPVLAAGLYLYPLLIGEQVLGALAATSQGSSLPAIQASLALIAGQALELRAMGRETLDRYREINLLYHIAETIGACLDPVEISRLVLEEARSVLQADLGAVLLPITGKEAEYGISASFGAYSGASSGAATGAAGSASGVDPAQALHWVSRELIAQVCQTGRPDILDNPAGEDLRLSAVLCVPMRVQERVQGVVLLSRLEGRPVFTASDEKLAMALAGQAAIAGERARLHRQEIEQQRLEEELDIGRRIQLSLLPNACPDVPGWEFAAFYQAARQVGGDLYDFIELSGEDGEASGQLDGQIGLAIADVTGKGVPAALMMASARAILRTSSTRGCSPKVVLERANRLIAADNRARLFLSAFYATLDPHSGRFTYANGGHERPYWLRASSGECLELAARGVVLGAFQSIELEQREIQIDPGDLLVFYTDGITEARGPSGEMFEEERLLTAFRASAGASASEALQAIVESVKYFVGDTPQADDLTLFVIKRSV